MDQYAVFGNPIAQSKSPFIHSAFAEATGEQIEYKSQLVAVDDFASAAQKFFQQGGKGLNITAPFKGNAYSYATQLSARARRAGAVNTLALQADGTILGDTTDGVGLVNDICNNLNWPIKDKSILILGAGGAVRGVLQSLFEAEPVSICIANRTASKAVSLAKGFADLGKIQGIGLDQLGEITQGFDLVISATSAGLVGEEVNLPTNILKPTSNAYDMIYSAKPTAFMRWASPLAAKTSDGLGMLVGQAAASFALWRGVQPETQTIIAKLRENL